MKCQESILLSLKNTSTLDFSKFLVSALCVVLVSTHWELNLTTYHLEMKKYVTSDM